VQATKGNAIDILRIKEIFSKLLKEKIIKMYNKGKPRPRINMTTKGPSRK